MRLSFHIWGDGGNGFNVRNRAQRRELHYILTYGPSMSKLDPGWCNNNASSRSLDTRLHAVRECVSCWPGPFRTAVCLTLETKTHRTSRGFISYLRKDMPHTINNSKL